MSIAYDYSPNWTPPIPVSKPRLLLIDGQCVPSASGRSFKTLNPATEEVIATVAEGNEVDVDRAVAAARRAFEGPWRTMRASERGQILLRLVDLMMKQRMKSPRWKALMLANQSLASFGRTSLLLWTR